MYNSHNAYNLQEPLTVYVLDIFYKKCYVYVLLLVELLYS